MSWVLIALIVFMIVAACTTGGSPPVRQRSRPACRADVPHAFCHVGVVSLPLPPALRKNLIDVASMGQTIPTPTLQAVCPAAIQYYAAMTEQLSTAVGERVKTAALSLPTSCCLEVHKDNIKLHGDLTVLVPVTLDNTCTAYVYRDPTTGHEREFRLKPNTALVVKGDGELKTTAHDCSKERRAVLSMRYLSTPPSF